jgi:hypothetical protein
MFDRYRRGGIGITSNNFSVLDKEQLNGNGLKYRPQFDYNFLYCLNEITQHI